MKRRLGAVFLLVLCLPLLTIPLCNDKVVDHYIDKIWLHRTNTIEKLHEFEGEYKNFECDVLFVPELSDFRTGHDTPSSESLGLYLDFLGKNPGRELWIDLKSLNEANSRQAESLLTAMLARSGASKEQLMEVSGIGEAKYAELEDRITVGDADNDDGGDTADEDPGGR